MAEILFLNFNRQKQLHRFSSLNSVKYISNAVCTAKPVALPADVRNTFQLKKNTIKIR